MKKLNKIVSIIAVVLFAFTAFGQAPLGMSYQAVVRNSSNNLVTNAPVGMQVSILQGSASGTAVFVETHNAMANANGLVTIEIGTGTPVSGSIATIIWTAGPFYIMTETDPNGGTDYTITSVTKLLSVPYALYAETSGSSTPGPQGEVGPAGPAGPEGPMGPQGPAGEGGMPVNCLECHNHNSTTASALAQALNNAKNEIEYSKHAEGAELAISEGGSAGCAPCHSNEGFHSVVDNNVVPAFVLGGNGKYSFSYNATAAASSGLTTMPTTMSCFTCHKGNAADSMALYTTAAVPMVMYGGTKTINLTQKGGSANLCVKCHQPRTIATSTTLSNGASVDYADLAANPTNVFFSSAVGNAAPNKLVPSYRTGNHYGTVGAVFAGMGAVEFAGAIAYENSSTHSTVAACQDCHMASPTGTTGGHSFWVKNYAEDGSFTMNFKGCNKSGCHSTMSATSSMYTSSRANIISLLTSIASKLTNGAGVEILHKNPDHESNAWAPLTPAGYDGYFDVYDPSTNPGAGLRNMAPTSSWTAAQKATNLALPAFPDLSNLQMGAIVNFTLFLREYSLGVHNPAYTQAVLNNTLDALTAAGY